ncbi:hypothetical protein [Microvirga pudoricolor]|uniref:hypothetical protein n=1 Tax=Microvirga pudoricolor TaxID=2778729 RepID=UPI0019504546|nr:hypothetical protein [Microvirga pudoricolor]MBM6595366.1 hypothetical protein [Microvirga pudoricolor]
MARLLRFMLRRLLVAMVALGLASTTWHGVALAASYAPAIQADATHVGHQHGAHKQADQKPSAPGKSHSAAQNCCHPACTMAVIPFPSGPMQEFPLSAPLRVTGDPMPVPESPSGLDRPPKAS